MRYILGLDVGISSVGWAVVRCDEKTRIEDFGVRMFDSCEYKNGKNRKSQDRRQQRATRRLVRRRSHRKQRLKQHLEQIGFVRAADVERFFEESTPDLLSLRVKGLTEQLTPVELAACLIHISNHRGYQDFYALDNDDMDDWDAAEKAEYLKENEGINRVAALMAAGGYRSSAEMFLKDPAFDNPNGGKERSFRHHPHTDARYPISRDMLRNEASDLLLAQGKYYPCLLAKNPALRTRDGKAQTNHEFVLDIIFKQRDFEDGPGDGADPTRKYTGFLDDLGKCRFYHEEDRGFRFTVTADLYALCNTLSQYRYIDMETGELILPPQLAEDLVSHVLRTGSFGAKDLTQIAKLYHVKVDTKTGEKLSNCIKYLRRVKPLLMEEGVDWLTALGEDPTADDTLLNQIGVAMSKYQTPRRRIVELQKIHGVSPHLAKRLAQLKLSGTNNVSTHYMRDAIEAFRNGECYGNFQARFLRRHAAVEAAGETRHIKLPPFDKDVEFATNPVVLRSINETRKIVNAVVEKYGSPWAINIGVASELGRSFAERRELDIRRAKNEKTRLNDIDTIAALLNIPKDKVTGKMVERYRLGEQQGWVCLYSGRPITDKRAAIAPQNREYEVSHIIPFSLILDNTLNNKVLVYMDQSQRKGQRTPLMALTETERDGYVARVNLLAKNKAISDKKRQYLLLPDFNDRSLLDEWKSRNLNDTRYITKYLTGYLERTLQFSQDARHPQVFAVKGALTSHFRRLWLSRETWGRDEKDKLRIESTLHHAVDAVINANISRATAQIAEDNMRLNRILRKNRGVESEEYRITIEESIRSLSYYYGVPREEAESYLRRTSNVVSLIPNLAIEVDVRFNDGDENTFRSCVNHFYSDDPAFAAQLQRPVVSYKQNTRYQGGITTQNAISVRQLGDKWYKMDRKSVLSVKASDLKKLYTDDKNLIDSLEDLLDDAGEKTVADCLKVRGLEHFVTQKGHAVHKVTLIGDEWEDPTLHRKTISENNYTDLDTRSYYCIEVYRDTKGLTRTRGIRYADIVKKDKKLWLKTPDPENYAAHIMYLFKKDYIVINNRNGEKFRGYFAGAAGIKQSKFDGFIGNSPIRTPFWIAAGDTITKYAIDLMGNLGGAIHQSTPIPRLP